MKKNLLILAIAILLGGGITFFLDWQSKPESNVTNVPVTTEERIQRLSQDAPDVSFTTLDGEEVTLNDLEGRLVVLNFWASWCPPCVAELPDLIELADLMGADKMTLVLLSSDLNREAIDIFLSNMGEDAQERLSLSHILIAWDERGAITRGVFQTYQLPETILIDGEGRMREKIVGIVKWTSDEMITKLEALLNDV